MIDKMQTLNNDAAASENYVQQKRAELRKRLIARLGQHEDDKIMMAIHSLPLERIRVVALSVLLNEIETTWF